MAVDGADSSDIMLIDPIGCPTDINIMGLVKKVNDNGHILEIPFDAFKFPSSDVVQFRALVTPCLPVCEPVVCNTEVNDGSGGFSTETQSFGRRRRKRSTKNDLVDEEMVVVQSIKILDAFEFEKGPHSEEEKEENYYSYRTGTEAELGRSGGFFGCLNTATITILSVLFLSIQLILVLIWAMVWHRTKKNGTEDKSWKDPFSIYGGSDSNSSQRYLHFMKSQCH